MFDKTLNSISRMRRWTEIPPFLKFTNLSIFSQFVKNHVLKYPISMSKTTSLLTHMTKETDVCRNEHSSCLTVVAMGQNVKTYPTTQCKFVLIWKMGYPYSSVPPGCNVLNNAKPFSGIVYWHIRLSGDANRIVRLLMAVKKNDKN